MVRPCGDQVSLQAFQQAVVDLTLSYPRVRDVREGRDDKWLASYDLTPRERDRIMSIVSQPGMSVHCTLSRGNRLEVVYYAFPMTCVLLGSRLRALVDELWAQHRPTNYQLAGEENTFAEFVGGRIAAAALSIDYLPEILAYETTCLEMTREYRVQEITTPSSNAWWNFATHRAICCRRWLDWSCPGRPAGWLLRVAGDAA